VAQVERRNELKRYAGHPLFVASAFVTWFKHYDHSRPHFAIQIGDDLIDGCYFAIVSKTSPYTFLGPRPVVVAPEADLDSRLSVTAFRTLSFVPVIAAVGSALGSGKVLRRHPRLVHRADVESVTVIGSAPFPYQVDGDHLGDVERLDFAYEDDALTIVVP
jgi:diacylglycerol kinase family enzyme